MTPLANIQNAIKQINKIGYEKRCYDFVWFDVFRYDRIDNEEFLTVEIYQNIGRDNYGWSLYKIKVSVDMLTILDFDIKSLVDLQQKANELKYFIQDKGCRCTEQKIDKNIYQWIKES